jgi:hypothetical protein
MLAKLLAMAGLTAVGHDSISYKEAIKAVNAKEWAVAC